MGAPPRTVAIGPRRASCGRGRGVLGGEPCAVAEGKPGEEREVVACAPVLTAALAQGRTAQLEASARRWRLDHGGATTRATARPIGCRGGRRYNQGAREGLVLTEAHGVRRRGRVPGGVTSKTAREGAGEVQGGARCWRPWQPLATGDHVPENTRRPRQPLAAGDPQETHANAWN